MNSCLQPSHEQLSTCPFSAAAVQLTALTLFFLLRQGFSEALEPVLELSLVDQAGIELTDISLPSVGIKGVRHHRPAQFYCSTLQCGKLAKIGS